MAKASEDYVSVGGRRVRLTSLDKVLYPETGTTKADVLAYYSEIAPVMLPLLADRPATRKRWVHGVGTEDEPGEMFFQKNLDDSTPEWVARRQIQHKDHTNDYPLVNDLATLAWLTQIAALEIHVPQWRFGSEGEQLGPDRMVLDLDPGDGVGLLECAEVARYARDILDDMGLTATPVTSGSKGIHLYARLDGTQGSDDVSAVAHELARALEADHPDLVISSMKRSARDGKVFIDWSQNNGNKTTVAPYSLRGRLRPYVAAPRTWRELASQQLKHLEIDEVLRRVKRRGDPLADAGDGAALPDRLATYRSMRDPNATPEPVPSAPATEGAGPTDGASYVIQEHHARALHWDFRLESDGVLVSWALPKGVPTDQKRNHLAVQTEDHPLEYGSFAGTIPRGQYGAGEVTIWDSGHYELEKWREGKEVIVTLHGSRLQQQRYALIHTGSAGENSWLIHLMAPAAPAKSSGDTTDDRKSSRARHGHATPKASTLSRPAGRRQVGSSRRSDAPSPMLATLGTAADVAATDTWSYELKWDGIRAIAIIADGTTRLVSRNGIDITATYPELADLADSVEGSAVIDGEIVALGRGGRPDFGRLQTRMKLTIASQITEARQQTPVHFFAFDVLDSSESHKTAGTSLLRLPYTERRDILDRIVAAGEGIQVPGAFDGDFDAALQASTDLGLEGVVAKRLDGTYTPGKRSPGWVKIKHHRTQEVVIGGWRPGSGARSSSIGSLLLAVNTDDGLSYVGRVGTGFSDNDLKEITARLRPLARKTSPLDDVPSDVEKDAQWVTPSLVGEVEFAEWTPSGRLRQPSWRGWRPDKNARDVRKEGS